MTQQQSGAAPKEKKPKISVVDITLASGAVARFYVRHYDPRQGKAWLLENNVDARVASQDEIVEMVQGKFEVMGPFEKPATALDDTQMDLVEETRRDE